MHKGTSNLFHALAITALLALVLLTAVGARAPMSCWLSRWRRRAVTIWRISMAYNGSG